MRADANSGADDVVRGVVGPNAVIQLGHALTELLGLAAAQRVFTGAGFRRLLEAHPEEMIDEAIPAALMSEVWRVLPRDEAYAVSVDAGRRTADYVIAHRIPRIAKWAFRILPQRVGARLLLQAIQRNAWTFVGSGTCETHATPRLLILIRDNPLAMPDCAWHSAVFERLFQRLVAPGAKVRHVACREPGDALCRFEIDLP